jgi:predicted small secreted protein
MNLNTAPGPCTRGPRIRLPGRHAAAVLFACVLLTACSEATNGTGTISKRLGEAVRTPGATEVDLGSLTSFGWDSFYAFKPGVAREEVCQFIGAKRNHCGRIIRIERAPEDHTFIVFGLAGQLTHVELHALANGRFDFSFPPGGHPRSASVFTVRREAAGLGEVVWLAPK